MTAFGVADAPAGLFDEGVGVADGAGDVDLPAAEPVDIPFVLTVFGDDEDAGPDVAADGDVGVRGDIPEAVLEIEGLLAGHGFGVGEDEGVGAFEGLDGLAEEAGGEEAVDEGVAGGVDGDDVELAGDLAVLEAVVEEDDVDFGAVGSGEELDEAVDPVGLGDDVEGAHGALVDGGFVGVGAVFALGVVAAHGDGGLVAGVFEDTGEVEDEGGFAGAAG